MERTETVFHVRRRAVEDAHSLHRQPERIGGDLQAYGLEALADARRAHEHRYPAVGIDHDARALARPGRAALDEAADRDAVVSALHQLALQPDFLFIAELREAALERLRVVAAVELLLLLRTVERRERVRHVAARRQVAAS